MTAGIGSLLSLPAYGWGGPSGGRRGLTSATAYAGTRPVDTITAPVAGTKYWVLWRRNGTPDPTDPADFTYSDTFDTSALQRVTPAGQWSSVAGRPVKAPRQVWVTLDSTLAAFYGAGSSNNYVQSVSGGYNPYLPDIAAAAAPAVNALGAELVIQLYTGTAGDRQFHNELSPGLSYYAGQQFTTTQGSTFASPLSHPPAPLAAADEVSAYLAWAPPARWVGGEVLCLAVTADVVGGSPRPLLSVSFSGTDADCDARLDTARACKAAGMTVRPDPTGLTHTNFPDYASRNPGVWSYDFQVTTALAASWAAQYARWGKFALKWAYHTNRPTFRWESLFALSELEPLHTLTGCEKLSPVSFTTDADCAAWIVAQATAFFA